MIATCKLYGRLGNQLFQIAATIAYALKFGFKYKFPENTENPDLWPNYHHQFNLPLLSGKEKFRYTIEEINHNSPIEFYEKSKGNVCLNGFFQKYTYFERYIDQVRNILGFSEPTKKWEAAIHLRLGDYRDYPDKHPILPFSYYREAIDLLLSHVKIDMFSVFSDEPEYCKEHINEFKPKWKEDLMIDIVYNEDPVQSIKLMASYKYFIIGNSSFSLFPAILNKTHDNIVIAPKVYFGPGNNHLNTNNMMPESFIRI